MSFFDYSSGIIWFVDSLCRIAKLIKLSAPNVHWMGLSCIIWALCCRVGLRWIANLVAISTSLWSSLDVVLDLLLLFFVWITNLNSLTDLSLLGSVKRIESGSLPSVFLRRGFNIVRIVIDIRIVHSIAWASLWRAWSLSTLRSNPSCTLPRRIICSRILRFTLNLILCRDILSLVLLLHQHLLFNLLLMQLLTRSQIKVINYVGNISDAILLCFGRLLNLSTLLLLETVLDRLTLVILRRLISLMSSISISWVIFAKIAFICLLLISEVDLVLFLGSDILSSEMLASVLVLG